MAVVELSQADGPGEVATASRPVGEPVGTAVMSVADPVGVRITPR
jgi:hypothetical protein